MSELGTPLRVGQFSAYYGDRADTLQELLDSNVDVLAGDYLAELTMLVLKKRQMRGGVGYASGFVDQIAPHLARIKQLGVKIVVNAGGLEPAECASAVRTVCETNGVDLTVVAIDGDDFVDGVQDLIASGDPLGHLDDGTPLPADSLTVLTANAYLGAWPIVDALSGGADIVICPRVTDASLVIGPAAWHFGWLPDEFDKLAGALWAGHAIECGAQVTGGNFSLFTEHDDLGTPGMPIAEIFENGSTVITKAVGTGGAVTVDTVTAQLLYEVGGAAYHNPDVVADLSSVSLSQVGPDRVLIEHAKGFAPTGLLKVSLCFEGGYRNSMTVGVTGAHVEAKLAWLRRSVEKAVGPADSFDSFRWSVIGAASPHEGDFAQATAWVVITARDRDRVRVGRAGFANPITQLGVSNIPGLYLMAPPAAERLVGVQWPCLIDRQLVEPRVLLADGSSRTVKWPEVVATPSTAFVATEDGITPGEIDVESSETTPAELTVFGDVFGTRSGDKGGMANLGVWARSAPQYDWLREFLTVDKLVELFPEIDGLRIVRHTFSNLHSLNFQLFGYLEEGVAACTRIDPQAKGVGEFLGSRRVAIPARITRSADDKGETA